MDGPELLWIAIGLYLTAALVAVVCVLWIVGIAFLENRGKGLLCLLGLYLPIYAISRWSQCRVPLMLGGMLGIGLLITGPRLEAAIRASGMEAVEIVSVEDPPPSEAPDVDPDAVARELLGLQGTWDVAAGRGSSGRSERFVIDGLVCTIESGGGSQTMTIRLDPGKSPHALDLVAPDELSRIACIYELKGDSLKLCLGTVTRPERFEDREGEQQVFVLRRR